MEQINQFQTDLLTYLDQEKSEFLKKLNESKKIDQKLEDEMVDIIKKFVIHFNNEQLRFEMINY